LIVVDASECELVNRRIYCIAARCVNRDRHKSCKVGYVKALFNQEHLVGHRVGIVPKIPRLSMLRMYVSLLLKSNM
jgi:hypothetical protein